MRNGVALVLGSMLTVAACGEARSPSEAALARPSPEAVRVAVGDGFSCVLRADASVWCWGELPAERALGSEADVVRAPHAIVGMSDVHEIAADDETLCARTAERRVICWGPDVRGEGARAHPIEVAELRGASSIALSDGRVCGLLPETERAGLRLRCVGPNVPRFHEELPSGAWLEAAGGAVCVLDGRGPARCVEAGGAALWPVTGSETAVSLAVARGVCVTTVEGELRCDELATLPNEASLRPVESAGRARLVRGTSAVRCLASADDTRCDVVGEAPISFGASVALGASEDGPPALVDPLTGRRGASRWHACALDAEGHVRCAGMNTSGEVSGHGPERVQPFVTLPGARTVVVLPHELVLLTEQGRLHRIPRDQPEAAEQDPSVGPLLDLVRCQERGDVGTVLCGRAGADRLVLVGRENREVAGFVASGAPFPVFGYVCAPRPDGGVSCVDDAGLIEVVPSLAQPFAFGARLCGLRGGRVWCSGARGGLRRTADLAALAPLEGGPSDVVRLLGGAEQLFAELRGGAWVVMGHNGAGQLGLAPSRPIDRAQPASVQGFASMAFAYHLSCGWNASGPVVCAGVDDGLRPRTLDLALGIEGAREPERGDGSWTPIPDVSDVVALDSDGRVSCALDRTGRVWCWGDPDGGAGARTLAPTSIELAP